MKYILSWLSLLSPAVSPILRKSLRYSFHLSPVMPHSDSGRGQATESLRQMKSSAIRLTDESVCAIEAKVSRSPRCWLNFLVRTSSEGADQTHSRARAVPHPSVTAPITRSVTGNANRRRVSFFAPLDPSHTKRKAPVA